MSAAAELVFEKGDARFRARLGAVMASGGGSGIVHEAERAATVPGETPRIVVKRARPGGERLLEIEARAGERLTHPNLVRYLGRARTSDGTFVAFERLAANPVQLLAAPGTRPRFRDPGTCYYPLPPGTALELAFDLAGALEYLHGQGLVHGDVKLGNFLVRTPDPATGARDVLAQVARGAFEGVLIDLGSLQRASARPLATAIVGAERPTERALTPLYAPPEALFELATRGTAATGAVDVYALGLVLYVLVTGRVPYDRHCRPQEARDPQVVSDLKVRESRGDLAPVDLAALDHVPLHDVAFVGGARAGWPQFRSRVEHLIRGCTDRDPSRRPTASLVRAFLEHELRVRPADAGQPRRFVQGLFRMRPLSNRLTGDEPLGGITVRLSGHDAVGEERPVAPREPAARPAIELVAPDGDAVVDLAATLVTGPAARALPPLGPLVSLGALLERHERTGAVPFRGAVVVSTASLDPGELAKARVLGLDELVRRRGPRRITLGRHADCDLPLEAASVSREHAAFERGPAGWVLVDRRSANGTWVDGHPLLMGARRPLQTGFAAIRLAQALVAFMGESELAAYLEQARAILARATPPTTAPGPAAASVAPRAPVAPPRTTRIPSPRAAELEAPSDLVVLVARVLEHGSSRRWFLTFEGGAVRELASPEATVGAAFAERRPVVALEAEATGGRRVSLFKRGETAA